MTAAAVPGARVVLSPEFIQARDNPTITSAVPAGTDTSLSGAAGSSGGKVWSSMQQAIFGWVEAAADGSSSAAARHLVIEALAGSGKSTTIVEALRYVYDDQPACFLAFNKEIVTSLRPKVPAGVKVATCHSYSNRALTAAFGSQEPNRWAAADRVTALMGRSWDTKALRGAVTQLVSRAKGSLVDEPAGLDALADSAGIDLPDHPAWSRDRCIATAARVLRETREQAGSRPWDFDDMIWLPLVLDLPLEAQDWIFVDETQDLNPAQLEMIQRIAGDNGRIVAVGDRHQSIYGFRGADRGAIPRMIAELAADVLPLSVSYRCPAAVVREAQALVPELQAAPGAKDGIVRSAAAEELQRQAGPGDFVISRTNAPLVQLCFQWLAAGKRATIRGRDLAGGLATWVRNTKAQDIPTLQRCLREWEAKECARLEAADRPADHVLDKSACLEALMQGAGSPADVVGRIDQLFDGPEHDRVVLTSTHRAKGLEADRCWLLRDTYMQTRSHYRSRASGKRLARSARITDWDAVERVDQAPDQEEKNLFYVAITRSKNELIYVHGGS